MHSLLRGFQPLAGSGMGPFLPLVFALFDQSADKTLVNQAIGYFFLALLFRWVTRTFIKVKNFFAGRTIQATLPDSDPAFLWVQLWISYQLYNKANLPIPFWAELVDELWPMGLTPPRAMRLVTQPPLGQARVERNWKHPSARQEPAKEVYDRVDVMRLPAYNTPILIKWRGIMLKIVLTYKSEDSKIPDRDMVISTKCRSRGIFDALIREAHIGYLQANTKNLNVWISNGSWQRSVSRAGRPWSSIILPPKLKSAMLNDCKKFLESRQFYADRGLPYRRGYMLYGPPGTGKSSSIAAIATELGLDVYMISLNSLRDVELGRQMAIIPPKAIIVMEDIDCATTSRESDSPSSEDGFQRISSAPSHRMVSRLPVPPRVSLSALLNAIDGIGSAEGQLLFCTTNYPDKIDSALSRVGRCDVWFEYARAAKEEIVAAFIHFYTVRRVPDEADFTEIPTRHELEKLANQFAAHIEPGTVTVAQLQGLFLRYRDQPDVVVTKAKDWVDSGYEQGPATVVVA